MCSFGSWILNSIANKKTNDNIFFKCKHIHDIDISITIHIFLVFLNRIFQTMKNINQKVYAIDGHFAISGFRGPAMLSHTCLASVYNPQDAFFPSVALVYTKNGSCNNSAIISQS